MRPWRRRPASGDFYSVAKHRRHVPDAEVSVAVAALTGAGPLGDRLVRQLRETADAWMRASDDGTYELWISTTDDLTIRDVPRAGWMSGWIPVVAMPGSRAIELQIVVVEAGIVGLHGRTADGGRWPDTWAARPEDLEAVRVEAPWLDLPTSAEIRAARRAAAETIGAWLADAEALRGRRGVIQAEPPATDEAICAFEAREAFTLPEGYRSLLRLADSIEIGRNVVLGSADAYRLDIPGPPRLVIVPPDEDGAIALAETGEVIRVGIDDATSDGRVVAPDLRAWLVSRLG